MYRLLTIYYFIAIILLETVHAAANVEDKKQNNLNNSGNLTTFEYDDESRIINGTRASLGAYKYMCSLQNHVNGGYSKFCGGSLIHRKWILTAAHCLKYFVDARDISTIRAVCGVTHAFAYLYESDKFSAQILPVHKIYMHPYFTGNVAYGYDIALIELSKDAVFNRYIQAIQLPPPGYDPIGRWGLHMGWGGTDPEKVNSSKVLLVAAGKVLDRKQCEKEHGWVISESQLCIFCNGSSVYIGDSGGPHVQKLNNGKDIIVGVASFVRAGGRVLEAASVFTNVVSYIGWIRDVLSGNYDKYVPKPPQ